MTKAISANCRLTLIESVVETIPERMEISTFMDLLGITDISGKTWIEKLPFTLGDVTAGTETNYR